MSADKGWALEYILGLTYRQFEGLIERYWDRVAWEIELQAATNPLGGGDGEDDDANTVEFDATSDAGLAHLHKELGINVKIRKAKTTKPPTDTV